MISSAKGPFFQPKYIATKLEAEKYLLEECPNLNITIIKPGVVVDAEHRWWSIPAEAGNNLVYNASRLFPKGLADAVDILIPAPST